MADKYLASVIIRWKDNQKIKTEKRTVIARDIADAEAAGVKLKQLELTMNGLPFSELPEKDIRVEFNDWLVQQPFMK